MASHGAIKKTIKRLRGEPTWYTSTASPTCFAPRCARQCRARVACSAPRAFACEVRGGRRAQRAVQGPAQGAQPGRSFPRPDARAFGQCEEGFGVEFSKILLFF